MLADGVNVQEFVTSPRYSASVAIVVQTVREIECSVGWDPIEPQEGEAGNPYHGEIWGIGRNNKRRQKYLQDASEWVVEIPGVDVH